MARRDGMNVYYKALHHKIADVVMADDAGLKNTFALVVYDCCDAFPVRGKMIELSLCSGRNMPTA
jgi:hypothetical protein